MKVYTINAKGIAQIESQWLDLTGSKLCSSDEISSRLEEKQGSKMAGQCCEARYEVAAHYTLSQNPEFITLDDEHFDASEIED